MKVPILFASFFALGLLTPTWAQAPPVAPTRPVTNTYFGTTLTDPYQWMEDLGDPAVKSWFRGQADATNAALARLPGRPALLARIRALDSTATYVTGVQAYGPYVFYEKRRPQDDNYKLYVREGLAGSERLLVDPEALTTAAGVHSSLDYFVPSLDGSHVAYALSPGGSENSVLHVLETATGKSLAESITRTEEAGVQWLPEGLSFFYNRLQKLAPGQEGVEKFKDSRAYLHRLGTDADTADVLLVGTGVNPAIPIDRNTDFPGVIYSPGAPGYVFAVNDRGVQNELAIYAAPLATVTADAAHIPWKKVCDFGDDVTAYDAHGDALYLLSHKNAPRFQVLRVSAAAPDIARAAVVVPQGDTVLRGLGAASDALYVHALDAGLGRLRRVPYDTGKPQAVPLPFPGALDPALFTDPRRPGILFATESGTHAPAWFGYDAATGRVADTGLQPPVAADFSGVTQAEVRVRAADGALVPLSILYPKGMKFDGTHPALVDGYGAYSIVSSLDFQPSLLAWVERGGVYAVAHVRGGGELGEAWYRAGYKGTKPNTWRDMIACGQFLVDHKYTNPARLSGEGTSAGGITIGRAITERPDLWGAALIRVGSSNALRSELSPNGPDNVPEFGTATDPAGFQALYAMDAYQHVQNGVKYPAVLLTTGINDPRVASWEPAKMTARLQAATASGKPVLLRVDYDAGHGIGSTKAQRQQDLADEWSFLLWQLGDPAFQPKAPATIGVLSPITVTGE